MIQFDENIIVQIGQNHQLDYLEDSEEASTNANLWQMLSDLLHVSVGGIGYIYNEENACRKSTTSYWRKVHRDPLVGNGRFKVFFLALFTTQKMLNLNFYIPTNVELEFLHPKKWFNLIFLQPKKVLGT